mgnify:CR=1 FL=1
MRTDRNGIASFEKVPFGTYRIVEAKPLAGYLPAEMEVEVTIDGTFINPEHPIATIINVPNEIVIRKVDQDGKEITTRDVNIIPQNEFDLLCIMGCSRRMEATAVQNTKGTSSVRARFQSSHCPAAALWVKYPAARKKKKIRLR